MEILGKNKNYCQSCGVVLDDIVKPGTNEDGSKNLDYCHFCFFGGTFSDPFITKSKMINEVAKILSIINKLSYKESKKISSNFIPGLKRWKS